MDEGDDYGAELPLLSWQAEAYGRANGPFAL